MRRLRRPRLRALALAAIAAPLALLLVLGVEAVIARRAQGVPFQDPPRGAQDYARGQARGPTLVYAVLGDSTAVGQGGDYERGIAVSTARRMAGGRRVRLTNLAVAGARTEDLLRHQVERAARLRPDVALIAVGANDVTRLTSPARVRAALLAIVERLTAANCNAKIVLTGSPDMGAVPHIAQPLRWVTGLVSARLNRVFESVAAERGLTMAPLARETGPLMRADPTLFAPDGFHPNDRGYHTWTAVLGPALDRALATQPSHCG